MMQHTQTHSHRFGRPLTNQTKEPRRLHPYHLVNDPYLTISPSNESMDVRQLKRIRESYEPPNYKTLQDVQTWQLSRSDQCWNSRVPPSPVSPGHTPLPLTISTSWPSQYFLDPSSWQNRMPISPVSPVHPTDLPDPQCIHLPFGLCNINTTTHTSTTFPRLTPFPTTLHDDIPPSPTYLHARNPENVCIDAVSQLPSLAPAIPSHSSQPPSLDSTSSGENTIPFGATTAALDGPIPIMGAKATRRLSIADLCNPIATLQHDITVPAIGDEVLNLAEVHLTEDEVEALKGFSKFHCFPVYNPSMDSVLHRNEVIDDKHDDGNEIPNNK